MPSLGSPLSIALAAGLFLAAGSGCGDPKPPGGSGTLTPMLGQASVLEVAGSPYEMGWWHGHLLKDRIRTLHAAWRDELRGALTPGEHGGAGGKALRRSIDNYLELCVDQTLHRLSERMLQELEGLASGCGLTKKGVIRLDVMRDALRMKGMDTRFAGAVGLLRRPAGYVAAAYWSGADAVAHRQDLILIRRRPEGAPQTCVVAWPGSLGGLAGVSEAGVGYVSAEGQVNQARRMGFGGGRPFTVAAREALENAARGYDLFTEVTGTMGHAFLAFSMEQESEAPAPRVQAMAGFHVYTAPDPQWILDDADYIAVGPYDVLESPDAVALQQAIREPDLDSHAFWHRLTGHATPGSDAPHDGPSVSVRFEEGKAVIELGRPKPMDGGFRAVTLD